MNTPHTTTAATAATQVLEAVPNPSLLRDPFCDCEQPTCVCAQQSAQAKAERLQASAELEAKIQADHARYNAMSPEEKQAEDARQWALYCENDNEPLYFDTEPGFGQALRDERAAQEAARAQADAELGAYPDTYQPEEPSYGKRGQLLRGPFNGRHRRHR